MNVSRFSMVLAVAGVVVLSGVSNVLADRGRGSDDARPRQEDRRDDRRQGSSSSCDSNKSSAPKNANRQRLRLIGRVGSDNNGGIKTVVKYEARGDSASTTNRRFDVEVQGLAPGATLNVTIKGASVGTITANSLGVAKLELRPSPDDSGEQPIPGTFPRLVAGDVVSVGSVAVTLRAR